MDVKLIGYFNVPSPQHVFVLPNAKYNKTVLGFAEEALQFSAPLCCQGHLLKETSRATTELDQGRPLLLNNNIPTLLSWWSVLDVHADDMIFMVFEIRLGMLYPSSDFSEVIGVDGGDIHIAMDWDIHGVGEDPALSGCRSLVAMAFVGKIRARHGGSSGKC